MPQDGSTKLRDVVRQIIDDLNTDGEPVGVDSGGSSAMGEASPDPLTKS